MFDPNVDILGFCSALHTDNTGCGDPLPPEKTIQMASALQKRLSGWSKSICGSEEYDNAVQGLIIATLLEYMVCGNYKSDLLAENKLSTNP